MISKNERIEHKKYNRIILFIACALLLYISGAIFYNKTEEGVDRKKERLLVNNPPRKVAVVYSAPYSKSNFTYQPTSNQIIIMFIL